MRRLLPRGGLHHQAPAVRRPETHAGRPLDDRIRRSFEQSFDWDFSRVRIHAEAAEVPAAGARAITVGEDIFFGPEQYTPGRLETRWLLAHELAHVVQQKRGGAAGPAAATSGAAEAEAARVAMPAVLGAPVTVSRQAHAGSPQHIDLSDDLSVLKSVFPQLISLSDEIRIRWQNDKSPSAIVTLLASKSKQDRENPDVAVALREIFPAGSDELWMAETTQTYGPLPFWPEYETRRAWSFWAKSPSLEQEAFEWTLEESKHVLNDPRKGKNVRKNPMLPIKAHYVPGESPRVVLIIGGVHGDEPSGVEVVQTLLKDLKRAKLRPYYSVVIVPILFPQNYNVRREFKDTPTNRNLPREGMSLAKAAEMPAFDRSTGYPVDAGGRWIERENVMLLELIEKIDPIRIASVHAHSNTASAGVFAEERVPGARKLPAGKQPAGRESEIRADEQDSILALKMAESVAGPPAQRKLGLVRGNKLDSKPTSVFSDPGPSHQGVSFGEYMRRPVSEGKPSDRPAISTFTIEVAGTQRSDQVPKAEQAARKVEIQAYADALRTIFLEPLEK